MQFFKYEGLGNDFVLLDGIEAIMLQSHPSTIKRLCDRRFGIGADGILLTLPADSSEAAIKMIYYNADGSIAETCFNGLRCVALHAVRSGRAKYDAPFIIESPTGPVNALVNSENGLASIELPGPIFTPSLVPVKSENEVVEGMIPFSFGSLQGTALSIGNPHFVVWRDQTTLSSLQHESAAIGAEVEKSPKFPNATNFELASIVSRSLVEMAVWERGVGPTLACGSGATATVCAGVKSGRLGTGYPVKVRMPGGELSVEVAENLSRVKVVGGARFVFLGVIEFE